MRIAEPYEAETLLERIFKPFHAENGLAPLDVEITRAWIGRMIDEARLWVVDRDGEIAGAIGVQEFPLKYAQASILVDEFYYVRQEWRGDSVGRELMRAFKNLARMGDQPAVITVFNPGRAAKKGRFSAIVGWLPFGYQIRVA